MGQTKKKILIVDDQEINRGILKEILENEYVAIEAVNGKEALSVLRKEGGEIHAVLLDLVMPEMDGYAFLKSIRNTSYADIPIIVQTGENSTENENRALKLGAWDFVSKPYQPEILLGRLRNAIARSEIGAYEKVRHLAEHDLLTDLYNRQTFYRKTRELIDDNPEILFTFIRFDIDSFNLINSFWGEKEGQTAALFGGSDPQGTEGCAELCLCPHQFRYFLYLHPG
jgi:PleD family two-component response regulator